MPDRRILILDDEPDALSTFQGYFAGFQHGIGYVVETATKGAEAAAALRRGRPDLIVLDVHMKGLDGLALLKQIRAIDKRIPVIVVAGRENGHHVSEALPTGVFAYAPKPCDFLQFEHLVGLAFASRASS